jgi:hypothetical protein
MVKLRFPFNGGFAAAITLAAVFSADIFLQTL